MEKVTRGYEKRSEAEERRGMQEKRGRKTNSLTYIQTVTTPTFVHGFWNDSVPYHQQTLILTTET